MKAEQGSERCLPTDTYRACLFCYAQMAKGFCCMFNTSYLATEARLRLMPIVIVFGSLLNLKTSYIKIGFVHVLELMDSALRGLLTLLPPALHASADTPCFCTITESSLKRNLLGSHRPEVLNKARHYMQAISAVISRQHAARCNWGACMKPLPATPVPYIRLRPAPNVATEIAWEESTFSNLYLRSRKTKSFSRSASRLCLQSCKDGNKSLTMAVITKDWRVYAGAGLLLWAAGLQVGYIKSCSRLLTRRTYTCSGTWPS